MQGLKKRMVFYFNQGPHALCLTDLNDSIIKEIGITFTGGVSGTKGKAYLISGGSKREVPGDYGSWLSSVKSDGSLMESEASFRPSRLSQVP